MEKARADAVLVFVLGLRASIYGSEGAVLRSNISAQLLVKVPDCALAEGKGVVTVV